MTIHQLIYNIYNNYISNEQKMKAKRQNNNPNFKKKPANQKDASIVKKPEKVHVDIYREAELIYNRRVSIYC